MHDGPNAQKRKNSTEFSLNPWVEGICFQALQKRIKLYSLAFDEHQLEQSLKAIKPV